ncbi:MAG: hypothetical protein CVT48_01235 [Thermoplasmata archaeon HGW-Thermoplasmata-1]|nr:MAG: hypothetical protein CVT48_01235 [Thermoplasmata archaeon HGW-Thermoplasmata-1]
MEYTVVVILNEKGEFMLLKHRKRGWEFPGGKLEEGETPEKCAIREILEETGYGILDHKVMMNTLNGEGGRGYVVFARLGRKLAEPQDPLTEKVEFFRELPPMEELSFPHDPYAEILEKIERLANSSSGASHEERFSR